MASKVRIPSQHREHAPPDDILPRLTQAEADHRAAHVAKLHDDASRMDGEPGQATRAHAEQIRRSLPIREYHERLGNLSAQITPSMSIDTARVYSAGRVKLKSNNSYPDDFAVAVLSELKRGVHPRAIDIDGLLGVSKLAKSAKPAAPVTKAVIEKAVDSAMTDLNARQAELLKDVRAFKAEQESRRSGRQ